MCGVMCDDVRLCAVMCGFQALRFGTGNEVSYGHFDGTSAEMSWVRSVLGPKCIDT